ncbi:MAG: squalene synthase HpnC [Rhodospirillaceae bacterium]|nr:squalene synthase HpnC [Rhodospirillaceae bacterium]
MLSKSAMTDTSLTTAETPSGKGPDDENFPVGSIFLPASLRPHVAIFYAYARAIDDVADNPLLTPIEKVQRLEGFEDAVRGKNDDPAFQKGHAIRKSLIECGVTVQHCCDLIIAFKQDATKHRYKNWKELINYCNKSAAPVGRYLLDIHGEEPSGYPASDALCNALQVINHLQDCSDDYKNMDRVYLPTDWLTQEKVTPEALNYKYTTANLRVVLDKCLDATDDLLIKAKTLPNKLKSKRLAMETATIIQIAVKLTEKLRTNDPIAQRVELNKLQFFSCCLSGFFAGLKNR